MNTLSKKFRYVIVGVCIFLFSAIALPVTTGGQVYAQGNPSCSERLLTLPVWYRGLTKSSSDCTLDLGGNLNFVWVIGLNVVEALMHVVGYVAGVFILIGGYRYATSAGEPSQIARAKGAIMNAVIGLIISTLSIAVINFIIGSVT